MASSSHKANVLNTNYRDVGMVAVNGTLLGAQTTLVVQMLASPVSTTTATVPTGGTTGQTTPTTGGAQSQPEPEPEPEPKTVVGPTEVFEEGEAVSQPAELAQAEITPLEQIVQTVNPVSSPKTVPLGFGFFLVSLFALDEVSMLRGGLTKEEWRRTAENIAHMVILGLLMVAVWLTRAGGVL